jgi:hypothetical protein
MRARTLWVPAVNSDSTFGLCSFIEIDNPWSAQSLARAQGSAG